MSNTHLPATSRKQDRHDVFVSLLIVFFSIPTVLFTKTTIGAETKDIAKIKDELKIELVMAAHMPAKDLVRMSHSSTGKFSTADFTNQPLTLLVLMMHKVSKDELSADQTREISYTEDAIDPGDLLEAIIPTGIYRYFHPAPSVIQLKYIRTLTCTIKGDTATGIVTVAAKPWQMSPHYVARKINGKWKVVEFSLPVNQAKTVLGKDGSWKISTVESKRFP